ncbi:hypothetical protein G6F22_014115 [Rhizopus arrhizus]|nr:hypothetical protein G6F22_014115 [Rhizopus arrhizus]
MSDPLCFAASTTSTPRASPATMRLRLGKCGGRAPIAVAGGVDAVDAGAHDRHRARPVRAGVQRAFMRRRIDAQRQSADDAPAVRGQMAGEGAGVFLAPGRGVAGAHDGQRRALQIGRVARHIQQDGRVGDSQQALRIGRVGQRQDVPAGGADPFQRAVHLGRHVLRHGRGQLARQRFGNLADQRRGALRVDLFGQAERAQQHAGGGGTDVGFQGQPQPGGQFGGRMRDAGRAGQYGHTMPSTNGSISGDAAMPAMPDLAENY